MLVEMGVAVPADEECAIKAGMSHEAIRAAQNAYERLAHGIAPEDFAKFDAGEIAGYNPDGSYIPGPNAKSEITDATEPEDEEDQ